MYAIESNKQSAEWARENIVRNGFTDQIEVISINENSIDPFNVIEQNENWKLITFTMCNPPFFDENKESIDDDLSKNRSGNRKPPTNVKTGIECEIMTPGGEVEFVSKMIQQSKHLKHRVNIFTTMLGHKTSFQHILNELKANEICNFCSAEFCQGKTTRWGIAWTFRFNLLLRTVPMLGATQPKSPINFYPNDVDDIDLAAKKVLKIMSTLAQPSNPDNSIESLSEHSFRFIAFSNSWSNQRRKRREQMRNQSNNDTEESDEMANPKRCKLDIAVNDEANQSNNQNDATNNDFKQPVLHIEINTLSQTASEFKTVVEIQLKYLNGIAGINGLHELLQFIRNKWPNK